MIYFISTTLGFTCWTISTFFIWRSARKNESIGEAISPLFWFMCIISALFLTDLGSYIGQFFGPLPIIAPHQFTGQNLIDIIWAIFCVFVSVFAINMIATGIIATISVGLTAMAGIASPKKRRRWGR